MFQEPTRHRALVILATLVPDVLLEDAELGWPLAFPIFPLLFGWHLSGMKGTVSVTASRGDEFRLLSSEGQ